VGAEPQGVRGPAPGAPLPLLLRLRRPRRQAPATRGQGPACGRSLGEGAGGTNPRRPFFATPGGREGGVRPAENKRAVPFFPLVSPEAQGYRVILRRHRAAPVPCPSVREWSGHDEGALAEAVDELPEVELPQRVQHPVLVVVGGAGAPGQERGNAGGGRRGGRGGTHSSRRGTGQGGLTKTGGRLALPPPPFSVACRTGD